MRIAAISREALMQSMYGCNVYLPPACSKVNAMPVCRLPLAPSPPNSDAGSPALPICRLNSPMRELTTEGSMVLPMICELAFGGTWERPPGTRSISPGVSPSSTSWMMDGSTERANSFITWLMMWARSFCVGIVCWSMEAPNQRVHRSLVSLFVPVIAM